WQAPIDPARLAATLEDRPRISHVAAVHHETTTGRLNALAELGRLCKRLGRGLFVDTVSSFGAEALELEDWGVTACAATANKCLHGVPGASFVIVRRDGFPRPDMPARTVYLDLACYARQQDGGSTPFTPSVQVFYALAEALRELEDEGGWRARRTLYAERMSLVHTGFTALGIAPFIPVEDASVVLHAYYLPNGISYLKLHDRLKEHGFVIYAGQADLARIMFRVSTMGAIALHDLARLVGAVEGVVRGVQGDDGYSPDNRQLAKDA
ncbi:MAG: aminotransferase class V-fold PLP-dependent enzyme, partial [Gammaproteobacteria bacterium]